MKKTDIQYEMKKAASLALTAAMLLLPAGQAEEAEGYPTAEAQAEEGVPAQAGDFADEAIWQADEDTAEDTAEQEASAPEETAEEEVSEETAVPEEAAEEEVSVETVAPEGAGDVGVQAPESAEEAGQEAGPVPEEGPEPEDTQENPTKAVELVIRIDGGESLWRVSAESEEDRLTFTWPHLAASYDARIENDREDILWQESLTEARLELTAGDWLEGEYTLYVTAVSAEVFSTFRGVRVSVKWQDLKSIKPLP